ncbi:MAG: Sjogren's syndrome/scleroderma autoantigen 1 family protein [ANME-2 cluster archaeon]|nr:Sjogren's syndrome/scleroderma autoantigen 1 family protein [ANME-2 cluster archaeon]
MVKTEEDTKLEKIGKYLEMGGTMLAKHCECGAPLFRYHGNVVCPLCDSDNSKGSNNTGIIESRKNTTNTLSGKTNPSIPHQALSSQGQLASSHATVTQGAPPTPKIVTSSEPPVSSGQTSGYETSSHGTSGYEASSHGTSGYEASSHGTSGYEASEREVTTRTAARIIAPETQDFINNTIINKVVQLCLDLQRETDLGRIQQQMEAIKSGTKALKNLRKIN